MIQRITADDNQTIYDIAVQHYGNVEAVGELLRRNPSIVNDPAALAAQNIDYMADDALYLDIPILSGTIIEINTQSPMMNYNIKRDIAQPITTYGTDN